MKIIKEDYSENVWMFLLKFDERVLQCKYYPKKDEADWEWKDKSFGSLKEIEEAKKYLVLEKIIPKTTTLNN